ncbi:MAG TPA: bacillithiol biosynthesis cysteine-adding enzyme BshC [Anaeromyxobacteraceae bacterium]|nr:bacillithiol biosynthesis cysteine-adding enzyme BshC [Anaeromyxobacteraceae bacterium]
MGSDFFASFISGDPAARALLPARPLDEEAWVDSAERAGQRRVSRDLLAELRRQAAELPPSAARERHLDALAAPGSTVVATGQQVGLFLGPLYTLHKAATAVARARFLSERTGRPCIPLFWLQTEDHDWKEISRAELLLPSGRRTLELPPEAPGEARVSLAHRLLPPAVDALASALSDLLAPLPFAAEVAHLATRHYRSGVSPGAAFAGLLSELFAEEGLVVLDPRTPAVARLARPVLRRAIEGHEAVSAALSARARELRAGGFAEQVHTRPEASLVFFHPRGPLGPRYRLVRDGEGFRTPDGRVELAELLARLDGDPLWFSTSALLRPLLQDALLPTAAYAGGPAEVSYFAEVPPLYELFGIELPLVAPRARLRILDGPARRELERLGLRPEDSERPRDELLGRLLERPAGLPGRDALRERLLGPMEREIDALSPLLLRLDPSLERSVRKTRHHATFAVERLLGRVERSAFGRDQVTAGRLDRLLALLQPGGEPQERVYSFPVPAARVGTRALVAALVAAAGSLSPEMRTVTP